MASTGWIPRRRSRLSLCVLSIVTGLLGWSYGDGSATAPEAGEAHSAGAGTRAASKPLTFIENAGQINGPARFYLSGPRGTVFFTPTEIVFDMKERAPDLKKKARGGDEDVNVPAAQPRIRGVVIRLSFPGANPNTELVSQEPQPGRLNDFHGKDPSKWRRDIRTYGRIVYRDLYPGVDLEFCGENGILKRRLVGHGAAALPAIALRYQGANEVRVAADGALELVTDIGVIREEAMVITPAREAPPAPLEYLGGRDGVVTLAGRSKGLGVEP